ncbi:Retinoic acid receptor beta, partial [Ophiophagus hannah]
MSASLPDKRFMLSIIMTTSSRACSVPTVSGHMTHYPVPPYPLLFPPVIGGLSLSTLHSIQGNPSTNPSTNRHNIPSPA